MRERMEKLCYRLGAGLICLVFSVIAAAQTESEWMERANVLERQGIEALNAGNHAAVEQLWGKAFEIYSGLQAVGHQARLLGNFGRFYLQVDQPENAIAAYERAVGLARQFGQQQAELEFLLRLGNAYRLQPDLELAVDTYLYALSLAQNIGDIDSLGEAAGSLGQVFQQMGDREEAHSHFQLARESAGKAGNIRIAITASGAEGDLYYQNGEYSQAIDLYSDALSLARRTNDGPVQMELLLSIGNAYYFLGNCEFAAAFHDWGYSVATETDDARQQGAFLKNRGAAEYCLGRFEEALVSYEKSLEIAQSADNELEESQLLGNIGRVYIELGNFERALSMLEQELAFSAKDGKAAAQTLGAMGDAHYMRGAYREALVFYQRSVETAERTGYSRGAALMLTNIGAARLRMGNLRDAEDALRNAISKLKQMRGSAGDVDANQLSLFERESRSYRLLQKVLIDGGDVDEALVVAEAARAQVFSGAFESDGEAADSSLSLDDIRRASAKNNMPILLYSVYFDRNERTESDRRLYVWLVTPAGEVIFEERSFSLQHGTLSELVQAARLEAGAQSRGARPVERASQPGSSVALHALYRLLIEPVESGLPDDGESTLGIVPRSSLFMVPFAALVDENGNYLIDRFATVVASGIRQLNDLDHSFHGNDEALIVGDPDMPSIREAPGEEPAQLTALPGAREEAMAIGALLESDTLIGREATEEVVIERMQEVGLIHFATHGLLDMGPYGLLNANNLGYGSVGGALAFSPSASQDGLLHSEEIADLDLDAALVVLSACNTGRGRITGDGILGLSRAFLTAGARNALVSLWRVPDKATALLMQYFYQQVRSGRNFAQALREAMQLTRKDYPDPGSWSGFVLFGGG